MSSKFDICIIGSGPGGYKAAVSAALRGARVVIIEKSVWGGCCLNRGCVPKKAWYHSAKLIQASSNWAAKGLKTTIAADLEQAWQHQREVVSRVRESYVDYLARLKVSRLEGSASLLSSSQVRVDGKDGSETIEASNIIIATGSRPWVPADMVLKSNHVLSTDMLFQEDLPEGNRVGVLGSGVIATEMAFILSQFGKQVSWFARSEPMSRSHYSPQAMKTLYRTLKEAGVSWYPNTEVDSWKDDNTTVQLTLNNGEQHEVDWLLLATGRQAYTLGLGLENIPIKTTQAGLIEVNDYLQTVASNIYAIGDVCSENMTANQALADAEVAVNNILEPGQKQKRKQWVPAVVYSSVEMARLGLNDDQAEDQGYEPAIGFSAFVTSPQALAQADTEGFVRVLADMDSGKLLGGEVIGAEAGELIQLLAQASTQQDALRVIAQQSWNHPARNEEFLHAIETMANKWGLGEFVF